MKRTENGREENENKKHTKKKKETERQERIQTGGTDTQREMYRESWRETETWRQHEGCRE